MNGVRTVTPSDEELKMIVLSPFVLHYINAVFFVGCGVDTPDLSAESARVSTWRPKPLIDSSSICNR